MRYQKLGSLLDSIPTYSNLPKSGETKHKGGIPDDVSDYSFTFVVDSKEPVDNVFKYYKAFFTRDDWQEVKTDTPFINFYQKEINGIKYHVEIDNLSLVNIPGNTFSVSVGSY